MTPCGVRCPSGDEHRTAARDAALAFALAAAGYLAAAWKLAALSWDGSWYLFHSLQDRAPFTPHHRYGTYPVTWLLIRLSELIPDPAALGMTFGGLLALLPLGSLAVSWHYLRGETLAPLRVWPALGILLAPLPGQWCLISEATLVAQLLWPMLALAAGGPPGFRDGVCLLGLGLLAALLHPTAALVFGLVAGLFVFRAWKTPPRAGSRRAWTWAGVFLLLAVAKSAETMLHATGYERGQASLRAVYWQFRNAVVGYPLCFLGLLYVLGAVLLAAARAPSSPDGCPVREPADSIVPAWKPDACLALSPALPLPRRAAGFLCVLLALTGGVWAAEATRWSGLLDYRRFVLPAMLPLIASGCWHYHRRTRTRTHRAGGGPPFVLSSVAGIFALTLVIQSLVWGKLLATFSRELDRHAARGAFLHAEDLSSGYRTPLRHWSAIPLSVLLQGRRPRTIYVLHPESIRRGGMEVYPPDDIDFTDGWFALSGLDRIEHVPDRR